jgi:hypothetical protein
MTKTLNAFLLFLNEQNAAYSIAVLYSIAKADNLNVNVENCIHALLDRQMLHIIPYPSGVSQYILKEDIRKQIAVLPNEFKGRPYEYLLDIGKKLPKMKQN